MKLERRGDSVYYNIRDGLTERPVVRIECRDCLHSTSEGIEAEIVRRVNCHEQLVSTLRLAQNCDHSHTPQVLEQITDSLARAEGGAE